MNYEEKEVIKNSALAVGRRFADLGSACRTSGGYLVCTAAIEVDTNTAADSC